MEAEPGARGRHLPLRRSVRGGGHGGAGDPGERRHCHIRHGGPLHVALLANLTQLRRHDGLLRARVHRNPGQRDPHHIQFLHLQCDIQHLQAVLECQIEEPGNACPFPVVNVTILGFLSPSDSLP